MATLAELEDALINADKAGDADAARKLADAIHSAKNVQQAKPAAARVGDTMREAGRQVGLTARYALEGVPQALEIVTEPIRNNITDPIARLIAGKGAPQGRPLHEAGTDLANFLGLPKPQGANERVIADATRLGFGSMGLASGAGRLAALAPDGGKAGAVLSGLASRPGQQGAAAAGAGLAGGAVRESGGTPLEQGAAALAGGIAGGLALGPAQALASGLAAKLRPSMTTQQVDQQINLVLRGAGIDWAAVPERVRQGMRTEVSQAIATGREVNPDAVRRLLDFRRTNTTPTRGMLTQDPVTITREKNLAKVGANSTDIGLQRLPRLESENTANLLRNLDDLGARNAPDAYATGGRVVNALTRDIGRSRERIDSLYSAARDTEGRSASLSGADFTRTANQALDEAMVGGKLPESVASVMNRIARGEMPFTVEVAEQLKTRIGDLQRASTDGQERMALGVVRRALDNTPLRPAEAVNPGNLPAVPGTAPVSPAVLGEESIRAFNRARTANRAFMQRVESSPALEAVYDGIRSGRPMQPDQFVSRFITGQGASVADVRNLQRALASDPEATNAVRQSIAAHLRGAATNGTEDVNKFSSHAFNRALNNIGERKLAAFFAPDEVEQLRAVGRASTLMQAQPAGTAVNNSNSGALMVAKGIELLDAIAGKLPLGLDTTIQGVLRGQQQVNALSVPKSLSLAPPKASPNLIGPGLLYSNLLAPELVNGP